MYEVIFSKFNNRYIVRLIDIISTINPLYIGTEYECNIYISKNTIC